MILNPFIKWLRPLIPEPTIEDITMSIITPEILTRFAPALAPNAKELATIINASSINTPLRLAHFLAQAAHESTMFRSTTENLNYSATALGAVFGKYFPTTALRTQYARKPEKIANRVYANRMGNGTEDSGDGWRYRGRGYIQLTGKNNYRKYSNSVYGDERILSNPDSLASPIDAMKSAIWYWETNNLNRWADKDDVLSVSRVVNVGKADTTVIPHGMEDRRAKLASAKKVIGI